MIDRNGTDSPSRPWPLSRLFATLCLAWLLLYWTLLTGNKVLPWDAINEFYPMVYFNAHYLRMGLAPWWNPYIYSGYPQVADPQGMLFSPLMMGWMLLRAEPSMVWFSWAVLLHLLMGGAAMLALLRRMDANALGSLMGAIVFMAGGVAASRLEHIPIVLAYSYAPVVLLALQSFLASPSIQRGFLFGLAAGAMLTQLVQLVYLLGLTIGTYVVIGSFIHWRGYTTHARRGWLLGLSVAAIVAAAVALPQMLLSLSYTQLSNRPSLPLSAAKPSSLDARALLSLFDPNALHALQGDYRGPADRVEAYLYVGALPLLLLIAGWRRVFKEPGHRRWMACSLALAVVACLYAAGVRTPFYGWLYQWLPGIKLFRRPSDAAYLLNLSLAFMVGLAASQVDLRRSGLLRWIIPLAIVWLSLIGLHLHGAGMHKQLKAQIATLIAIAAYWQWRHTDNHSWRTEVWLLLILVADYSCFNLNGSLTQGKNYIRAFSKDPTVRYLTERLQTSSPMPPSRVEIGQAAVGWDNWGMLYGIPSTQGYNPLRYGLYDHWYGTRANGGLPRPATDFNSDSASVLNRLLGVKYVVQSLNVGWPDAPASFRRVFVGKDTAVWQSDSAYPRLLTPFTAHLLAPDEAPPLDAFASTDFNRQVWLTPRDANDHDLAAREAARCQGHIRLGPARTEPSRLSVQTHADAAGWLVMSELDFPGWQAEADGEPIPIHRANGMFRAVCVPAGAHVVSLTFAPWRMVAEAWH